MIRPRIIPCLLIKDGALIKTTKFEKPKYIGDPINAVRIFNEKCVDELVILDIDATVNGYSPNLSIIKSLATECRMPLCYGGGVTTTRQICDIIELGVEKVSLSTAVIKDPQIINRATTFVGSQSIVITLDVRKKNKDYFVFIENGKKKYKNQHYRFNQNLSTCIEYMS